MIVAAVAQNSGETTNDDDDDRPFFDLEFSVPDEDEVEEEGGQNRDPNRGKSHGGFLDLRYLHPYLAPRHDGAQPEVEGHYGVHDLRRLLEAGGFADARELLREPDSGDIHGDGGGAAAGEPAGVWGGDDPKGHRCARREDDRGEEQNNYTATGLHKETIKINT